MSAVGQKKPNQDAGASPPGAPNAAAAPGAQPQGQGQQYPDSTSLNMPLTIEGEVGAQRAPSPDLKGRLGGLVGRLDALAQEQVSQRNLIEERWIRDLQQYYGVYSEDVVKSIQNAGGSQLFANQTRTKSTSWAARLGDMLFPTDDKNWGIDPTPVPSLTLGATEAVQRARKAVLAANQAAKNGDQQAEQEALQAGQAAASVAAQAAAVMEEARTRANNMSALIDDQLEECRYNMTARGVINDAVRLGTGIFKGPVVGPRVKRAWMKDPASGAYVLQNREDARPSYVRTDPWSFFPDMSATCIDDAEFTFERHLPTQKELRRWKNLPGFDVGAIDQLLLMKPRAALPDYFNRLRNITLIGNAVSDRNYQAWEYHGPIEADEMVALAEARQDVDMLHLLDMLQENNVPAIVWFCDGVPVRYGLHPLESGDSLYSPYCFDRDETSIFGFGVPNLMRDPQAAFNAAWRMMINNSSLSSGPQIVINKQNIEPEDGNYDLYPNKVWLKKNDSLAASQPDFQVHEITNQQEQVQAIAEMAKEFCDDETSMPPIAYGESGSHVTKTAQGMGMLMNSANVIFRLVVKNFDDQVTVPNILRLYDWNMQFSADDLVKGDFDVKARGSSVLLVRELQSQNLDAICTKYAASPIFGPMLKLAPMFRKLIQSFMIDTDEVVKTDDEIEAAMQAIAQQAQQNQPLPLQLAKLNNAARLEMQQLIRQTALETVAAKANMTVEQLKTKLQISDDVIAHKEREFAAEAALTPADTHGGGGEL